MRITVVIIICLIANHSKCFIKSLSFHMTSHDWVIQKGKDEKVIIYQKGWENLDLRWRPRHSK